MIRSLSNHEISPNFYAFGPVWHVYLSCRETSPEKRDIQEQQNNIPSSEKQKLEESLPKKPLDKPNRIFRDSLLKKQKKSKDLDTLRPKIAMLE